MQRARNPLRLLHDALQRVVGEDGVVAAGHLCQTIADIGDTLLGGQGGNRRTENEPLPQWPEFLPLECVL
jgi:hypothetical protein